MTSYRVNKSDVTSKGVRDTLSTLPSLEDVIIHMDRLGWSISVEISNKKSMNAWVSFKKINDWNGLAIIALSNHFGFREEIKDGEQLLALSKRAAELCLRVQEAFPDRIPACSNIYGDIVIDTIASQPQYLINHIDFKEKHKDKQLERAPIFESSFHPFVFTYYNHLIELSPTAVKSLVRSYRKSYLRHLSGELPVICNNRRGDNKQ